MGPFHGICRYCHILIYLYVYIHLFLFSHNGQVKHYPIKQDDSKNYFITENHRFLTIKKLIDYHKINCAGVCVSVCMFEGIGTIEGHLYSLP